MKVLVVDDHPEVLDLVARALARDGHDVDAVTTTRDARLRVTQGNTDLIVLDVTLPDGSGVELCRSLRGEGSRTPILFLSAQNSVENRVTGLDAGADDFLGRPFAVAELRARVRALARRSSIPKEHIVVRGAVRLDLPGRRATVGKGEVSLTAREWALLELLASRDVPVSRDEILGILWRGVRKGGASLEVLIARIRKKLGNELIQTLRGYGYRLTPP